MATRFDQARPFLTLAIVVGAWLVIPTGIKRVTKDGLFEAQAPITATGSFVRDLQHYWSLRTQTSNELIQMGLEQSKQIAGFEFGVQQNESLHNEIKQLEDLLHLPAQPGYRFEPARVALRDFSGWWQRMTIRKGSNYGITVGAPVVFSGGVVGRITEVHAYTSIVELISNQNVRLAATVEGDNRPLSFQGGDNAPFSDPKGGVEYVPLDIFASATTPRRLVTSGLGGVFPAGVTIGWITRLEPSPDGLFKSGDVRLDPRLNELTEVTVLIPEKKQ